jgi:hypothetical protein
MHVSPLEGLLKGVNLILSHQKKEEKLKGESFNIFSILKMESKENSTHSAFLGELLNPKGSHLRGNQFLALFLNLINDESIDINSAKVRLEKSIGRRNDIEKTGGRVDIYIWDKYNNSLCIENKIYARDQNVQIERYYNHNSKKNKVYYLNLDGNEPAEWSKGDLIEDQHFHIISYKNEIVHWLKCCQKEAADSPILRESIKQYYILIKKLTATMDNSNEKELIDLILRNYEASEFIHSNFIKARQTIAEEIRQELAKGLRVALANYYTIEMGNDASNKWSKIWIKISSLNKDEIKFGVENFGEAGHLNGNMFFGVFLPNENAEEYKEFRGGKQLNNRWANVIELSRDEESVNLGDLALISKLNTNLKFRKEFIEDLVEEIARIVIHETPSAEKFAGLLVN